MNRPQTTETSAATSLPDARLERLSALLDGELGRDDVSALWSDDASLTSQTWCRYQLIGDVLRAGAAAPGLADSQRVAEVMARIRHLDAAGAPLVEPAPSALKPLDAVHAPAANDEVFRWKMVAGFAAVAAAAAVVWNVTAVSRDGVAPQLAQQAAPAVPQMAAVESAPVVVAGQQGPILRDARLEELLAAHRQAGGMSALQMPAGFLRSAAFELADPER